MAPMERLKTLSVLQGGVYIKDGTVNFQNCNIYDNEAAYVSAHSFHIGPWPPWN